MKLPIYLDNHATTAVDSRVLETMLPFFTEKFGNAASRSHSFGWEAESAVERARAQVASVVGAQSKEIIFTSGATESINIAIKGAFEMYGDKKKHFITVATEHKATLDCMKYIEKKGARVTCLAVDKYAVVDPQAVMDAITDETVLVSVMHGNNEVGTVHSIAEIGKYTRSCGILFHVDAAQTVGKLPIHVDEMNIDILSLSGHKIYGPKGIGALYVRRQGPRVRLAPVIHGGGHERGMRSGTLNVPAIVGIGRACEIARETMEVESGRLVSLRNRLKKGIFSKLDDVYLNGHPERRLPNNLNVSFAYVEGEALMMGLRDIAVSSGSACTSASLEPSYVLRAMGVGEELAHTSIRFGLGRFTTEEEIDYTIDRVVDVVTRLREMSPLYEMAKEGIDLKSVNWPAH
jgi:cysteine desulfurase